MNAPIVLAGCGVVAVVSYLAWKWLSDDNATNSEAALGQRLRAAEHRQSAHIDLPEPVGRKRTAVDGPGRPNRAFDRVGSR